MMMAFFEVESHTAGSEVGFKVCCDVDMGRFAGGILNDQEEFGDDFDDVAGLKYKVSLAFDAF